MTPARSAPARRDEAAQPGAGRTASAVAPRRRMAPVFALTAAASWFAAAACPGAVIFCAPWGNDAGPGTRTYPFLRPGAASRRLAPGDTLVLLPGRYVLSRFDDDILAPPDGRPDADTVIRGEPGSPRPVLAGRDDLFCAVFLASRLRVERVEITSDASRPFRDGLNGTDRPLARVTLRDLFVHRIDGMALDVRDVDSLAVEDCVFDSCGFGGIGGPAGLHGGLRRVRVDGCVLSHSGRYYRGLPDNPENPYDRPDGFGIEPSEGPVEIADTRAEWNRGDGLDSKAARTLISRCVVENNYGDGVKLWAGGSRVENTLVAGTGGGDASSPWSGMVIGDGNTAGADFEIVNCTVHDNPDRQAYPLYAQYPPASNPIRVTLRNTIVSGGHGPLFLGEPVDLVCGHNLFFRPGQDVQVEAFGREYATSDIEAGMLGPGNRVGDPLFVRPAWGAQGDYRLSAGSPALDAGSGSAPGWDLDGNARPAGAGTDMGCYEAAAAGAPGGVEARPDGFRIFQNRPNPFNPVTRIAFELPAPGVARLVLVDLRGRLVAEIAAGRFSAGRQEIEFDAGRIASGTYLCRLETAGRLMAIKMTLLR